MEPFTQQATASAAVAVVIVSHRSERWLEPCLRSLREHAGAASLEIVVVENGGTEGSRGVSRAAGARWIDSPNRGFAHANNVGAGSTKAPYVLFLNPDTEVVEGRLETLVDLFESRPSLGLVGARQVWPDRRLQYSIRRFPSVTRWLGEALGSESWPMHPGLFGERELSVGVYQTARPCDWTAGSFMFARRAALAGIGGMSEEFFLYCEEPDLCLRLKRAGWQVEHRPELTIVHHGGNESSEPSFAAQLAASRKLYAHKHFGHVSYAAALAALAIGYGSRAILGGRTKRPQARAALATILGVRRTPVQNTVPGSRET